VEPSAAPDPAPSTGPAADDWTDQVTELIVTAVDNVRRSTVEPVRTATKAIIWGALGIGFALPALAIALIAGFHLLVQIFNAATPGPDDNAWMAWYLLGIGAVVGGLVLFGRRNATDRG
jgi:hypothetical protein